MGKRIDDLVAATRVKPGSENKLSDAKAAQTFGWDEDTARTESQRLARELSELQYRLYADGRFALLMVLQAIDGGGKDSTIRHVCGAFNPQGCVVTSFKAPGAEELRHDYLWRIHQHVPMKGEVGVFNRSHYEDVLVVRVDELVPKAVWKQRYGQINDFERLLVECNVHVVKIFLHLSRAEQKRRFEDRIHEPRKQWKFDPQDLKKRAQWKEYRQAYRDMLSRCSTKHAPWHVIPADNKWLRDLAVSQILHQALSDLPLKFPKPKFDPRKVRVAD